MKKPINITYIDTHHFDYFYWEEKYKKRYCVSNPTNEEVRDFYDECMDKDSAEFWNDLENFCKYNEIPCVVSGILYLKDKEKKISVSPITYPNIVKAIHECVNNRSEYIVKQEDYHVKVTAYHTDGFSTFTIRLLNKSGIKAYERILNGNGNANLMKPCYHKKIMDCLLDYYN